MRAWMARYGIYGVIVGMLGVMVVTLAVVFGGGDTEASTTQIDAYVRAQPDDCRPVAQVMLERRMAERAGPLLLSDVSKNGVMTGIDATRCQTMAEQLGALGGRTTSPND